MSDTIDSSFGKMSLDPTSEPLEEPRRPSRLSQSSSRLSQTSSQRSRPKASLDHFFEDSIAEPQGGILYHQDPTAVRQETRHVDAMEKEIFNLKLKISLLERNSKLNADSKELYQQLTSSHAARRQLEVENLALKQRLESHGTDLESVQFKVAEQEEMLTTFLEAQDEYSRICDGILEAFQEPGFRDYAKPIEDTNNIDESQLDGKLAVIRNIIVNLLTSLQDAQDNYAQMEAGLKEYLDAKEAQELDLTQKTGILNDLSQVFEGVEHHQIVDLVLDLVANQGALENQLQERIVHEQRLEDQIEDLQQKVPLDVHAVNDDLRAENNKLMDAVSKASARSYDITRQFFRRLTAYMGSEWGEENDRRLRQIMEESRRNARSKLPLLVELMMQCVDELAMMARGSELLPQENYELEEKVKYLEDLLTQELTQHGADKVLLARYKDLEARLKIETEKRKNEYIGYQRSLTNLSLQ